MKAEILLFLVLAAVFSCSHRNPEIIHMDFLDLVSIQLPSYSYEKIDSSLINRDLYYLVNESNPKNIEDSMIWNFIKTDHFIQQEIHQNYFRLNIMFYHQSENTDIVTKHRTSRYLSDCNQDEVSEYEWNQGKFNIVWHFDNGIMRGSENIILEDIKHHGQ